MKRLCISLGVILFVLNSVSTSQSPHISHDVESPDAKVDAISMTQGITNFTIELLYHTSSHTGPHLVISPFSVWSILAIIAEGASGQTLIELQTKLRLPWDKSVTRGGFQVLEHLFNHNTTAVEMDTTSTLFTDIHKPFTKEFENIVQTWYSAHIIPLDFQQTSRTLNIINNYITRKTRGRITSLLQEDDLKEPQMIMSNVIYFKGEWSMPFNKSETTVEPFYNEDGKKIGEVNMMYQRASYPFANIKEFEAIFIELPYGHDNKYSMLVILPRKKVPLQKLFLHLATEPISRMFEKLKEAAEELEDVDSDIYLPRFKIDSDITLNSVLNDVGIFEVMDPDYAQLGGISKSNPYLSRVVHKAVIEVTEEGTVATAVTGGVLYDRSQPAVFKANRPFVYFVVEKSTNVITFAGIYSTPSLY